MSKPKTIDWMYHRKGWTGCRKAQEFLEHAAVPVGEVVNAAKDRRDRTAALELARSAKRVVTGRGKKIVTFDMTKSPPDDDTLAAAILGPSGNLKAPTVRLGTTLLVGFNEETYRQFFEHSE